MRLLFKEKPIFKIPTQNIPLGLPKNIISLCPECGLNIQAQILEKDNKIVMEKTCPEHGSFDDLISTDKDFYLKMESLTFEDSTGLQNPVIKNAIECPKSCGICNLHKSYACLTNIDLTNRCNLNCPICFASANKKGYIYEPSYEQIIDMLKTTLKANYPSKTNIVQFSGGEPTIHPNFLKILKAAKDLGFTHIQIATNGIRIANEPDFLEKCKEAGLNMLYLQFDGLNPDIYKKTRGVNLLNIKKRVIERCRAVNINVCLVPTIVNNINNNEIGNILRFAIENADVVNSVSFQPVAFTGRISEKELKQKRYVLSQLAEDIGEQTNYLITKEDLYPFSIISPLSKYLSKVKKSQTINITCHANCGYATYLVVNIKKNFAIPLTRIIDLKGFMLDIYKLYKKDNTKSEKIALLKILRLARKHYKNNQNEINFLDFLRILRCLLTGNKNNGRWRSILVLGMHFQDKYNFNVDRVKRCVIYYAAPNNKLYPFCTYNSGPIYREKIEKQFSIPIEEYKKIKRTEFLFK